MIVFSLLVATFAALATAHVALTMGLLVRAPRWRGPVALFVAPLAPWWGWKAGLRLRTVVWGVAAAGYGVALGVWLSG